MKTVTKTALANVKQNKGRNFLCGCAIALTTFLIFVVLTVGYGMIRVQLASVIGGCLLSNLPYYVPPSFREKHQSTSGA